MKKLLFFAYGLLAYAIFGGVFLYLLGFLGNFGVPRSIDSPASDPFWKALIINTLLVVVFGLQHTVMARPTFKRWWTKFVPHPIERSTYAMFTNAVLVLLFWQWRPMGGVIWNIESPVGKTIMYVVFAAGWITVFITTLLINHFDLFGLRQVWLYLRGHEYQGLRFVTPGPYKFVRHPLYVGWLLAFWATPTMTVAHLVFAAGMTVYILIAIQFEERNLAQYLGPQYVEYRRRVGMLLPKFGRGRSQETASTKSSVAS